MPRARLTGQGPVAVFETEHLEGITDLAIGDANGEMLLYSAGRGGGWLNRFSLGTGEAQAAQSASWSIPTQWLQLESTDIALISNFSGTEDVMLAGLAVDDLRGRVETGTGLGNGVQYDAGAFDMGDVSHIDMASGGLHGIAALRGGGLVQLEFGANGQVDLSTPSGLGVFGSARATSVEWATAGGTEYAVVGYGGSDQIALLRAGSNGQLSLVDTVGTSEGAWIDRPAETVTVTGADGTAYVVMAASGSSSLTVLAIEGNALVPVDHVIDTLNMRFDDASQLAAMDVNGQPYVVAAGSDQGLTVMAVLPGGQLLEVATIAASYETPLHGITDIEVAQTSDGARIFVATQGPPYLVEFDFTLDNAGATLSGTAASNSLVGTQGDDVISGGPGNDTLSGGSGDDILADGAGSDRLTGGEGADLFVIEADGTVDRINDFHAGTDSILMTAPRPGMDANDIVVLSRSYGAEIRLDDEVLHVYSANGEPLSWADLGADGLRLSENISTDTSAYPDNSPDFGPEQGSSLSATLRFDLPSFDFDLRPQPSIQIVSEQSQSSGIGRDSLQGTQSGSQIQGLGGSDRIDGGQYDDILIGAAGFDTISGGLGNDQISGGLHADSLMGGEGDDVMTGGSGFDNIYGDAGNDQIWGGAQPDRLFGGDGHDWMDAGPNFGLSRDGAFGGAGNDTIYGGAGFDILFGEEGNDFIDGGHQADNIYGNNGNDMLYGNLGFDRLFGGNGDDLLFGGDGPDAHFGDAGNDRMWGGTGDDRFWGGTGNDYIEGGSGNDQIRGNAGFDTIVGGEGNDTMLGNFNADRFVFEDDHGHDHIMDFNAQSVLEVLDFSELSSFSITSDVMGNARQIGRDVVIDTGENSSITLVNVSLSDLDGTDFLF